PQWALLVDGSALFFGQRTVSPDRNLDYYNLNEFLRNHAINRCLKHPADPKPAYFFTAADEANEKQQKFHHMISELGWNVRTFPPHAAFIGNPLLGGSDVRLTRFDAMIAYCLGRLREPCPVQHIFIISDSWPLAGPVLDCVKRNTPVTMVFFGQVIDPRWHGL